MRAQTVRLNPRAFGLENATISRGARRASAATFRKRLTQFMYRYFSVFFAALVGICATCEQSAAQTPTTRKAAIEQTTPPSALSAIWANNGEDKVTQNELRATRNPAKVLNSVWDGKKVILFGARNEVVDFNLVLEAGNTTADEVAVEFRTLRGPGGAEISSPPPDPRTIFNWTKRNVELFFVRYLQIAGLSYFDYNSGSMGFDERVVPKGLQRPWKGTGYKSAKGLWTDRPNHDAFYPDIAIPLELHPSFRVAQGSNQAIWADIYIPKSSPPGLYTGKVVISQRKTVIKEIPVELTVRRFSLPDIPSSKTMLFFGLPELSRRLTGKTFADPGTKEFDIAERAAAVALKIAHRHKISLIGDWEPPSDDQPSDTMAEALTGKLFTEKRGYSGPGENTGLNVYSILTYGGFKSVWKEKDEAEVTEADIWEHSNRWESWFRSHAPSTDRFLYLCDECYGAGGGPGPQQVEQWARWLKDNPKIGGQLKSLATISFEIAAEKEPDLDYVAAASLGNGATTPDPRVLIVKSIATIRSRKGTKIMYYNPSRPSAGSFTTEDDGVALREVPWAQYKKGIDRLYYWHSDYFADGQSAGQQDTDVFEHAATFGGNKTVHDPVRGEWSVGHHTNGNGVLFYPGTDVIYPKNSYGVVGVFASLRLKYWRRGIQDVDYITMAAAIDPDKTQKIVDRMVPRAFWDYKDLGGWMVDDISWSINPDDWEAARAQLAEIIETRN